MAGLKGGVAPAVATYQANRLGAPIRLRFPLLYRLAARLLLPGFAAAALIAGVLLSGAPRWAALFIGLLLGVAALMLARPIIRARAGDAEGAALRIDRDGVFMAHLGGALPWEALGPASVATIKRPEGVQRQVMLLVMRPEDTLGALDPMGRALAGLGRRSAVQALSDPSLESLGGDVLAALAAPRAAEDAAARLSELQAAALAAGALPVGAPPPLHPGLSPEGLAAILNAELLARDSGAHGRGDDQPTV